MISPDNIRAPPITCNTKLQKKP